MPGMGGTVSQFVESFTKAIRLEMQAMQQRLGSFELYLSGGSELTGEAKRRGDGSADLRRYEFGLHKMEPKLVSGTECTYRSGGTDVLVTVIEVDGLRVSLESQRPLDVDSPGKQLIIYPWFLYERLIDALSRIEGDSSLNSLPALRIFGKLPPDVSIRPDDTAGERTRDRLNEGQLAAVELCLRSDTAYVWGPPGTGKTTTLGAILTEFLERDDRVLVASTTNAAVDQVVAALVSSGSVDEHIARGEVVRVGQCGEEGRICSLPSIRRAIRQARKAESDSAYARVDAASTGLDAVEELLKRVRMEGADGQLELFEPRSDDRELVQGLVGIFGGEGASILPESRESRLEEAAARARIELAEARGALVSLRSREDTTEASIIPGARIVLATMANLYVNDRLIPERFDTVIIEEAGMAVLPAVFFCAALGSKRVICIGDPRQLPPIVQSDSTYAKKAMGRSIFDVAVPEADALAHVSLLSTQYRMHPQISALVSRVFYDGKLVDGVTTGERASIAALPPFAGKAVVVDDISGQTRCERAEGSSSRINRGSAQRAVDLASEAVEARTGSVGIITPYAAQSRLIRDLLPDRYRSAVECSTVHRFQGHECDCIIFDFTDASPMSPGLLLTGDGFDSQSANLLNVSLSRARGKLILVTDVDYFESVDECGTVRRIIAAASNGT